MPLVPLDRDESSSARHGREAILLEQFRYTSMAPISNRGFFEQHTFLYAAYVAESVNSVNPSS